MCLWQKSRFSNVCEMKVGKAQFGFVNLKQKLSSGVSVEPVLVLEHITVPLNIYWLCLQVPLLSFIARALCSPNNPTQRSDSPHWFIPCISLLFSIFARVVKATGTDKSGWLECVLLFIGLGRYVSGHWCCSATLFFCVCVIKQLSSGSSVCIVGYTVYL